MQKRRVGNQAGFTIVELLIVIVVIGILAAITIVAFTGVQQRGRDNVRMQDVASIRKALELHKAEHGQYPVAVANPGLASWEVSVDDNFLQSLSKYMPNPLRDPSNTADTSYYAYYRNPAGAQGCPASAGAFYVLRVTGLEALRGTDVSDLAACASSTSLSASRTPTDTQAVFFGFEGV